MRTITAIATTAAALLALTACSDDPEPDTAACKAAMVQQYKDAENGKEGTQPAACIGIDNATLQRLVGEVMSDQIDDGPNQDFDDLDSP